MAAHTGLGLIPGVERSALAAIIPTKQRPAVLLDVGANAECRPAHLLQFGVMGAVFAQIALESSRPRVGLLSIGEEECKGNELTREAHRLLKSAPVQFVGNVEARDVYAGVADVIVCDGFTGNVALKISESLVDMIGTLAGSELTAALARRLDADRVRRRLAAWCERHRHRRPRPLVGDGGGKRGPPGASVLGWTAGRAPRARYCRHSHECHVIAFLFPGQGSQKVGMGRALADAYPECRSVFDQADAALGESISQLCFDGPEDRLVLTENTQPAILTVSVAAARLLELRGIRPQIVAGHSLGEYSAHVVAGTFAFADAVRIVRRRGRYMQEAVPVGTGAMAAVLGLASRPGGRGLRGSRRGRRGRAGQSQRARVRSSSPALWPASSAPGNVPRREAPSA